MGIPPRKRVKKIRKILRSRKPKIVKAAELAYMLLGKKPRVFSPYK